MGRKTLGDVDAADVKQREVQKANTKQTAKKSNSNKKRKRIVTTQRKSTRRRNSTPEEREFKSKIAATAKFNVGTKVATEFFDEAGGADRLYYGIVTRYDASSKLYRVAYFEEGIQEDLSESEVSRILKTGKSAIKPFKDTGKSCHTKSAVAVSEEKSEVFLRNKSPEEGESSKEGEVIKKDNNSSEGLVAVAFGSYQYSAPPDDIDKRDADDPQCATAYVQELYERYYYNELHTSVKPVYMEDQSFVNERMRAILVDWLVEVHLKFKLVPDTLYLTVNIIDRYLAKVEVSRPKLQLIGATALLIASKYEEIFPSELRDLVYICDRAYSKVEILAMEVIILKKLNYQITVPTAHTFVVRYLKAAHADKKIVQLSCYILDGTLQSYELLQYLPSQIAAAAVFLARRSVGRNAWSPTLLKFTPYKEENVIPVARAILDAKASSPSELKTVNRKYTSSRYGGVANIAIDTHF